MCLRYAVKRDELWWTPKVMVEVHVGNRYAVNLSCYLDSLFHWAGGWFSDGELRFASRSACVHYKCFAVTVSWMSEVVLVYRKPWTSLSHSMQYFIFPGFFYWVLPAQELSAAWLWSHHSLPQSEEALGISYLYQIWLTKAKITVGQRVYGLAENSLVTLTRTLAPG